MKTLSVLNESIVPFDDAHKVLRGMPTRHQLNNWVRNGLIVTINGVKQRVKLEFCKVGGRPVTSVEAYERFEEIVNR
jgi:hypothetical protein